MSLLQGAQNYLEYPCNVGQNFDAPRYLWSMCSDSLRPPSSSTDPSRNWLLPHCTAAALGSYPFPGLAPLTVVDAGGPSFSDCSAQHEPPIPAPRQIYAWRALSSAPWTRHQRLSQSFKITVSTANPISTSEVSRRRAARRPTLSYFNMSPRAVGDRRVDQNA